MFKKYFTTRNITLIATFTAIAAVLYVYVKFPLPIFPSFLKIELSVIPALIAGFMMGPVGGAMVVVFKMILKLLLGGTITGGIGEFADLLIALTFVLISSLIYRKRHTRGGAIIGLLVGSIGSIIVALVLNRFVLVPKYIDLFGFEGVIKAVSALYPNVDRNNFYQYYLPLSVLPFNALCCIIESLVTMLVYKGLHRFIERASAAAQARKKSSIDKSDNSAQTLDI